MAKDTVILSPEYNNVGRREGPADGAIATGVFTTITATGIDVAAAGTASIGMLSTENIATAQELDYVYSADENVFCQVVPRGCLAQVKAAAGTYTHGQALEIGAGGIVTAQSAGETVAIIALRQGATVTSGQSLVVQLV